jgi:SulP family sulfate permease
VANVASVLFGGIPATGAIARTATNIRAGAATPISGIIHAATLLLILLLAGPLAARIPLPALAAVLVMVAWTMSELDKFRHLFRAPRSDTAVLLCTFLLTVLVDLNVAIQVGVLLAALLFMRRMIAVGAVGPMDYLDVEGLPPALLARRLNLHTVEVYEIAGPFFFGVADRLKSVLEGIERPPRVFILRMRHVSAIDATGLYALELFFDRCRRGGTTLVLSGVQPQPARALAKAGLAQRIGPENIYEKIEDAFCRAEEFLADEASGEHSRCRGI